MDSLTVIIVEDDPMVAQINKRYLQKVGGLTLAGIFPNGKLAMEYLKGNPVDLAVLDFYMPELNGLELLRMMRREGLRTEVIMVTAANDAKQVDEFLKLGVVDYLVKPFSEDRFIEALEKCQARVRVTGSGDELTQQAIDNLMGSRARPAKDPEPPERFQPQETPKGLNPSTLELILNAMADGQGGFRGCEELANKVGLSRVTVRRYLIHMAEQGQVESVVDYDTGGRPSVKYKLK
ncbi:MAG: response regulator [Deltaproteobacteria bacterium]|nr:response regulator [Deltaproteobacteria bacterium]